MFYKFSQVIYLLCLSQVFLGGSYFISTKAIADSLDSDIDQALNPSFINSQENFSHDNAIESLKSIKQEIKVNEIIGSLDSNIDEPLKPSFINSQNNFSHDNATDSLKSIKQEIEVNEIIKPQSTKSNLTCSTFVQLTNTIKPNLSPNEQKEITNNLNPTSSCAADLLGVKTPQYSFENIAESSLTVQKDLNEELGNFADNYTTETNNNERWNFKLQPYATIPINTYGTVSARGKTVSYHLSLGELLDTLRVAASGRFEGWKGRWGFIIDGYFASLQGIGDLSVERSREPNPINTLNFLLNSNVNSILEGIVNRLNQNTELGKNIGTIQENQSFQRLQENLQDFQEISEQRGNTFQELEFKLQQFEDALITGRQTLEILDIKVEDIQDIGVEFDALQSLDPDTQRLNRLTSLQVQDLPIIDNLREVNNQIRELNKLSNLDELKNQLIQTRDNLEQLSQRLDNVSEDVEAIGNIKNSIDNTKAFLDQQIQNIDKIQEFQANQQTQQLNIDNRTSLQFEQGIYDFAISYHFGDLPLHQLPDEPSNRPYPLFWFQPIGGVRLNDISIDIEVITTTRISSPLINLEATTRQNFRRDRTWFEPLFGGKVGLQISDPITFWLRGDYSGFGLAGDTNFSWNILLGMDWWVHQQISLQLGYRFYEMDYRNERDNNDFGFEENFNGPFISATFHF